MLHYDVRLLTPSQHAAALEIISAAAQRYRGRIPDANWHEPYMSADEFNREVNAGVMFQGIVIEERLVAVMGIQNVRDVDLIRHAYVRPSSQGQGLGRALLQHILAQTNKPVLVGTWKAAIWAIGFYQAQGFDLCSEDEARRLLGEYWTVSKSQAEASVVLRWLQHG